MYKQLLKVVFMFTFVFIALVVPFQVQSSSGIAVTGTFTDYQFKLLPGEVIETPDIYVLFFNHYDVDIEVELTARVNNFDGTPSGMLAYIDFLLVDTLIRIPANDSIRVVVGISISHEASPGNYLLGLSAHVIPNQNQGITVAGSAELQTTLAIIGEVGDLEFRTYDMFGDVIPVTLYLFRREGSSTMPVRTVDNGVIIDSFAPGDYFIVGIYKDYEVLRETFLLIDQHQITLHIVAQTVFIENLIITPLLSTNTELLSNVRINYTLHNIHDMAEDLHLILHTSYKDECIEFHEQALIPFLPENTFEGHFNYLPPDGWEIGTYVFHLEVYQGDQLENTSVYLGSSSEQSLRVPEEYIDTNEEVLPSEDNNEWILVWSLILSGMISVILIMVLIYKTSKKI